MQVEYEDDDDDDDGLSKAGDFSRKSILIVHRIKYLNYQLPHVHITGRELIAWYSLSI